MTLQLRSRIKGRYTSSEAKIPTLAEYILEKIGIGHTNQVWFNCAYDEVQQTRHYNSPPSDGRILMAVCMFSLLMFHVRITSCGTDIELVCKGSGRIISPRLIPEVLDFMAKRTLNHYSDDVSGMYTPKAIYNTYKTIVVATNEWRDKYDVNS